MLTWKLKFDDNSRCTYEIMKLPFIKKKKALSGGGGGGVRKNPEMTTWRGRFKMKGKDKEIIL